MLNNFLTALMQEIVKYLSKHPDFFKGSKGEREKALENLRIPATFKHYLSERKSADFLADMQVVIAFINAPKSAKIQGNAFFKALVELFTGPFASKIDKLSNDFYSFSDKDQWTVANELIKNDSQLAHALRDLIVRRTYQELSTMLVDLSKRVVGAAYLVVQTPREIDPALKKEIRHDLVKEYPFSFPIFQINKKLIGGIRIFKDGEVIDLSWVSRVQQFISLKTV